MTVVRRRRWGLVFLAACRGSSASAPEADGGVVETPDSALPGLDAAPDDAATEAGTSATCTVDLSAADAVVKSAIEGSDGGTLVGAGLGLVTAACGAVHVTSFGTYTTATVMPIASASKMPAVTAILTLVDAGALSLDDLVAKHLAFWPASPDPKGAITLRMLLSHTSGLPARSQCLSDTATTLDACAREIAALPLAGNPGTDFIYGGADYQVVGRIAEIVSGKSWNDLFRDALAVPCGLTRLSFAPSPDNALGSATNPRIAGGAASDVGDYLTLLRLHLSGGMCGANRVLSSALVAEMQNDVGGKATCKDSPYGTNNCHYGLGWWLDPPNGSASATVFGDAGAFGATPILDTVHRYGAFLLIKGTFPEGQAIMTPLQPVLDTAFP